MENNRSLTVLTRKKDFFDLKTKGRRVYASQWMCLNTLKNNKGESRVGWTVPRRVGGAVLRNKLKRWCREFFRGKIKKGKMPAVDVNVVIRARNDEFYRNLGYDEFSNVLEKAWRLVARSS